MNVTAEREELTAAEILGADGLLAQALTRYEPRGAQVQMAKACAAAMEAGEHALIEAGTGTGKSYAYLIPAILSGKRVVVSTDTIQLQEQLIRKDLPFLARLLEPVLGRPIKFAIAKGRTNFLCERNAEEYLRNMAQDRFGCLAATKTLEQFHSQRWDGDKSTLKIAVRDGQWANICGDESCTGRSCEFAGSCPYLAAKQKYEDADIVVTNHTMYLLHHYVLDRTQGTAGILPEHTVWVGDEAHTLADKCVDIFGVEIPHHRPAAFMKRIARQAKRLKLNLSEGDLDAGAVNRTANNLFEWFHGALKQEQLLREFPEEILAGAVESMEALVGRLKPVRLALYWAGHHIEPEDVERRAAVGRLLDAADLMIEAFGDIFAAPDPDLPETHVTYVEVTGSDMAGKEVTLHRKPIETRPIFQRILGRLDTAVFTSATLATGEGAGAFRPVAEELGLNPNGYRSLRAESPFEYARQVKGYVPASMPELRAPEYHTVLAEEIASILTHTQGKAFVLFTSIRDMRKVHELVACQVRFPILLQGEASKEFLVEQFQTTPNSVLMGVKTFWQGVDIPGEALSCVILVKLPFPQPEHPMNKARCDLIEKRGGNGFRDFSLPRCIRDVRQGFGRLIRTKTDTGLFAILDPRLRTARYGSAIANSLPNFPCSKTLG